MYEHSWSHSFQKEHVSRYACAGVIARGGSRCDGNHVSTNGTRSPGSAVNSATVLMFSPRTSTGVLNATASGPAIAIRVSSSSRRTHGTIEP